MPTDSAPINPVKRWLCFEELYPRWFLYAAVSLGVLMGHYVWPILERWTR